MIKILMISSDTSTQYYINITASVPLTLFFMWRTEF